MTPILTNCGVSTELALLGREAVEEEGLLAKGGRKTPLKRIWEDRQTGHL